MKNSLRNITSIQIQKYEFLMNDKIILSHEWRNFLLQKSSNYEKDNGEEKYVLQASVWKNEKFPWEINLINFTRTFQQNRHFSRTDIHTKIPNLFTGCLNSCYFEPLNYRKKDILHIVQTSFIVSPKSLDSKKMISLEGKRVSTQNNVRRKWERIFIFRSSRC